MISALSSFLLRRAATEMPAAPPPMMRIFAEMSFAGFAEHPPEKTGNPARRATADTCFVKSRLHIFSVNIMLSMITFPIRYVNSAESSTMSGSRNPYPGNVRELFNILERAIVFKENDFAKLIAEHRELSGDLCSGGRGATALPGDGRAGSPLPAAVDIPDCLDDAIRRHVQHVFEKYSRNVSKT